MAVEHAVSVMLQYGVTADMLQAIAVVFRISEDQLVIDVRERLLILECMKDVDVLSEMSKSPDVVTEAAAPENPEFNPWYLRSECKPQKAEPTRRVTDRHREIHAKTPPKKAVPPGKSAEVSLPSSPLSPMTIDGDEQVGGGEDGNRIEPFGMWTPAVARSIDNEEVKQEARNHSKINDSCLQALESCVSFNKKLLDKTKKKFDLFESEVSMTLNKFKEDIRCQYLKQDQNTTALNVLKQRKDLREESNATKIIENDNAEQNLELTTNYKEELDFCQDLQKRIQDTAIKAYYVHLNSNVKVSLRNACNVYVFETIKVCYLNVAGLAKRLAIPEFIDFIKKYDILCFSEINAFEGDKVDIDKYRHYIEYRTPAKIRSGGIGVYIHEKLKPYVKIIRGNQYVLWIKINGIFSRINDSAVLGAVYIPPKDSTYWNENMHRRFEDEVKEKLSTFGYVVLAGDFNSHTGTSSQRTDTNALPRPPPSEMNPLGKRLDKLCQDEKLKILNDRFSNDTGRREITFRTETSESVIDYVIASVSGDKLVTSFKVIGDDSNRFSDGHSTLVFEIGCNRLPYM